MLDLSNSSAPPKYNLFLWFLIRIRIVIWILEADTLEADTLEADALDPARKRDEL